jgi:hypothetical protein
VSGQLHAPVVLIREKSPLYPLDRMAGGSKRRSERCGEEKILDLTGTRTANPPVAQPVGSRYTDYAIPAQKKKLSSVNNTFERCPIMTIKADYLRRKHGRLRLKQWFSNSVRPWPGKYICIRRGTGIIDARARYWAATRRLRNNCLKPLCRYVNKQAYARKFLCIEQYFQYCSFVR